MDEQVEGNRRYRARPFEFPESVQDQLNAVFRCYGSVVHHAQQFEVVFGGMLTAYNRITSNPFTVEDIESNKSIELIVCKGLIASKIRRHASNQVKIDYLSKRKLLSTTLREKRFLLHRFFIERDSELYSDCGRRQMIAELLRIEHNLDRSRLAIIAYGIAIWLEPLS